MSDDRTCAGTFATLGIYHDAEEPETVTGLLGITPTRSWRRGEPHGTRRVATYPSSGWFLSSEAAVTSDDTLRHIEWVLAAIEPRRAELRLLRERGYRLAVSCYWASAAGHGGPSLTPDSMRRLAELDLPVSFDVYFTGDDDAEAV